MVEMKELKSNLFSRLKGFFLLHPVAVAIIAVIFAIMLFGGCEKAKAESVSSIEDWFSTYSSSSFDAQWQSDINTCPYYVLWDNTILIMAKLDYFGFACYQNASLRDYPCSIARDVLCNPWQAQFPFIVWYRDSSGLGFRRFNISNFSAGSNINNLRYSWTGVYTFTSSDYGSFSAIPISYPSLNASYFGTSENFYIIDAGNRGSDSVARSYTKIDVQPFESYTDDGRLKFAKIQDSYDGEVLMIDIRDFVRDFPIQDTSHSSVFLNPESITLKYTVDGTEKTITLDSNNSTIRSKYIFETPIFEFDFDDENASVVITKADFTIAGTSQSAPFEASQDYMISCNYAIKSLNPLPIPSPIPDPTYNDVTTDVSDPATVLQDITTQLINDSTTTNAFTGEWTLDQEHPIVPSWADNYDFRVIKSDFNSIISGVVNKDIWNYYTSNDPDDYDWITGGFNPRNFVDENRNFAFYDMIIISVYEANIAYDTTSPTPDLIYSNIHLLGYITLYSQRYFVHKSSITDSNILATLEYASLNDVAFYETIKASVDQFEEYTLGRLDTQLSIEKDSLAWLKTISSKIDDIEPYNDTSLLGKLDTIIAKLTQLGNRSDNEDDTVSEAIAYYKLHSLNDLPIQSVFDENKLSIWMAGKVHSWLQGTDSQTTKTSLLNDAFETLKSLYDSLTNEAGFFGNMEKYLLSLRGGNVQDRDGLYFSRFFQNSFDPDSYDGGSL